MGEADLIFDVPVFEHLFNGIDEGFPPVRVPPHAPPLDRTALPFADSSLSPTPLQVIQRACAAAASEAAAAASAGLLFSFHPMLAGSRGRAVARGRQRRRRHRRDRRRDERVASCTDAAPERAQPRCACSMRMLRAVWRRGMVWPDGPHLAGSAALA